jgi:hypothetical protein
MGEKATAETPTASGVGGGSSASTPAPTDLGPRALGFHTEPTGTPQSSDATSSVRESAIETASGVPDAVSGPAERAE